jgi:hypothetical protein
MLLHSRIAWNLSNFLHHVLFYAYNGIFRFLLHTALQAVVPFGVALPMVKKESRQGRRERAQDKVPDHEHPVYGIRLARLDDYFSHLEVCMEIINTKN